MLDARKARCLQSLQVCGLNCMKRVDSRCKLFSNKVNNGNIG